MESSKTFSKKKSSRPLANQSSRARRPANGRTSDEKYIWGRDSYILVAIPHFPFCAKKLRGCFYCSCNHDTKWKSSCKIPPFSLTIYQIITVTIPMILQQWVECCSCLWIILSLNMSKFLLRCVWGGVLNPCSSNCTSFLVLNDGSGAES